MVVISVSARVLLLFVGILPIKLFAQTACPVGVAAGSAQCGPSPSANVPSGGWNQQGPIIRVPTGQWRKTWGAIAADESTGDTGVSVGKKSEREALKEAIRQCGQGGSRHCKRFTTYENQCVVLIQFKESVDQVMTQGLTFTGATVESATDMALAECQSKVAPGSACVKAYSDCSKPIFEKY